MSRFATFAALYVIALFLEPAETWKDPRVTALLLALGVLLLAVGLTRKTLPVFLVVAMAHPFLLDFPDVPNHVNVEIYVSLLLLVAIGYTLWRSEEYPTDDDCFELVRPVLQVSMILIYVLAGFSKLNTDFLNPQVSCAGSMLADLAAVATRRTFGVPRVLLGAAVVGGILVAALSARPAARAIPVWARAALFALILFPVALAVRLAPAIPAGVVALMILGTAGMVILWELVGGLLLTVPRFQGPLLAFSWTMHAMLSLIGFVHFGALAIAMLFTFVPAPYLDLVTTRVRLPFVGRSVPRSHAYLATNLLTGVVSGFLSRVVAAFMFNLSVLFLLWPILRAVAAQAPRPVWPGVSLWSPRTPKWLYVFPGFLLLYGLTSYVGLRTAGNFTMFSNLRTEGARSNHLLLGSNPLKLWGYQEDVIRFVAIDDSLAAFDDKFLGLQGNQLPMVEFRKWIYEWTREGRVIPMTFEYRGQVYSTGNITADPEWRTPHRDWAMRLLDFRVIQSQGANECRW
jgi:hypothetical protein